MWQYIKSREFWLALGGILVLFVLLFVLFFWVFLPLYTRHSSAVKVPDLSQLTLEEADALLSSEGLRYEVTDSVFFPNMKPLAVMNQDPPALSKVKPGRKVYITVNKQSAPLVKLPDVLHVTLYQARVRLDNWGLGVGSVSYRPSELKDLVLEIRADGKMLKPGTPISVGARLDLIVGQGLNEQKVELPDLVGLPFASAILRLQELGLMANTIKFNPSSKEPDGTILRQVPEFSQGDSIPEGTEFTLFVAGEEPQSELEGIGDSISDNQEE